MILAMTRIQQVETAYHGNLFGVQVLTVIDKDGRSVRREVVRHPGAVLIVPVLNATSLVMIRNFRVAVDEALLEFPAGKLEPGEHPLAAAKRELREETGYQAEAFRKLGEFYTSPGFTDELMRVFVAEQLTHLGQQLEPGENIEVEIVPVDQALSMIEDGRIRDGKTIAGLFMWQLQRRAHPQESLA